MTIQSGFYHKYIPKKCVKISQSQPTQSTPTPTQSTTQKSLWSDVIFYGSITTLAVTMTSLGYYGYRLWKLNQEKEEIIPLWMENQTTSVNISSNSESPKNIDPLDSDIIEEEIKTEDLLEVSFTADPNFRPQ